jgi:hypothetical protein
MEKVDLVIEIQLPSVICPNNRNPIPECDLSKIQLPNVAIASGIVREDPSEEQQSKSERLNRYSML